MKRKWIRPFIYELNIEYVHPADRKILKGQMLAERLKRGLERPSPEPSVTLGLGAKTIKVTVRFIERLYIILASLGIVAGLILIYRSLGDEIPDRIAIGMILFIVCTIGVIFIIERNQ